MTEETKTPYTLELMDALSVLISNLAQKRDPYSHLGLINDFSIGASEDKLKNELRDKFTIVKAYLSEKLLGDFGWVDQYKKKSGRK